MDLDANAGGGAERGDQGDGPRDKPSARKVRNQKNRRRLQDRKVCSRTYPLHSMSGHTELSRLL